MTEHKNIGSNFDDFLAEEVQLDEVTAVAVKRVIAWQLGEAMKEEGISKSSLAKRMQTSSGRVGSDTRRIERKIDALHDDSGCERSRLTNKD